ncbi:MAG: von Willebrand factor type A domain-containing protein [Lentisphaeraceae bacterium]|nr:von Willebrand factor type A domain-containing protein [Lentisphaeraceae bacterium]
MSQEDVRITAYILGELAGQDRIDFEKEMASNPELKAEVDSFKEFSEILESELGDEDVPALKPEQREKILESTKPKKTIKWNLIISAIAACLVLGLVMRHNLTPERQLAKREIHEEKAQSLASDYSTPKAAPVMEKQVKKEAKRLSYAMGSRDGRRSRLRNSKENLRLGETTQKNPVLTTVKLENTSTNDAALEDISYQEPSRAMKVTENRLKASQAAVNGLVEADSVVSVELEEQSGRLMTGDKYGQYIENSFLTVGQKPLSTFSIDVDTASYTNLRSNLQNGYFPQANSVRIEEMINYFDYDYPQPKKGQPFSVNMEIATSPWSTGNKLVRIGLKGKDVKAEDRPSSNLVFLVDVSGSMSSSNKLPLLKEGFKKMITNLNEKDRVGIVVYAGRAGVVLNPTVCDERGKKLITEALSRLNSGGSTNGAGGIKKAYELVKQNFIKNGTNRVILATDGDFNVGLNSNKELIELVKEKSKDKSYLTVLGFGHGNLNDHMMEEISNKGNGNYFFIDSQEEGTRVLCQKISGTLVTIAKDVKIQVEFNPAKVQSYRLIGYDNRQLKDEDFNDDKKDAGEIGAGHTVTAIYEIVPVGSANAKAKVDALKYQPAASSQVDSFADESAEYGDELMTVKLRYKSPQGGPSSLLTYPLKDKNVKFMEASKDFIFANTVAAFGMLIKKSDYRGDVDYQKLEKWLLESKAVGNSKERMEFFGLIRQAIKLK